MTEIERGRDAMRYHANFPELASKSSEIAFLDEWLEEVKAKRRSRSWRSCSAGWKAIASELYERAAELRDAINLLRHKAGAIKPRITRIAGFW
jgi:hypothetical protein